MSIYTVDSVVCDYGVFEDGELKLICNSMNNALLIKAIMEKDENGIVADIKNMEKYKMFYYKEKELGGYTLRGTFEGEEDYTKKSFVIENGINIEEIETRIEIR